MFGRLEGLRDKDRGETQNRNRGRETQKRGRDSRDQWHGIGTEERTEMCYYILVPRQTDGMAQGQRHRLIFKRCDHRDAET